MHFAYDNDLLGMKTSSNLHNQVGYLNMWSRHRVVEWLQWLSLKSLFGRMVAIVPSLVLTTQAMAIAKPHGEMPTLGGSC